MVSYGRFGIFIVEVFNLTLSMIIIDKILRCWIVNIRRGFLVELCMLASCALIASFSFEGGNLTEEYSLPWLLISLYFCLKYYNDIENSGTYCHPARYAVYYGFVSGFLALIRITNAALVGAIVFSITVVLLMKKEFKNVFENAIAYIAGIVLAFIPPCIFYFQKGLLYEMFSQVFLFGVNYSTEVSFWDKLINRGIGYGHVACWDYFLSSRYYFLLLERHIIGY